MKDITFENLPQAVSQLIIKINGLEALIREQKNTTAKDRLLTVQETAEFLSLSVPTIYGLMSKKKIAYMKRSKRCYFSEEDLIKYIKAGKTETVDEISQGAEAFLKKSKK